MLGQVIPSSIFQPYSAIETSGERGLTRFNKLPSRTKLQTALNKEAYGLASVHLKL